MEIRKKFLTKNECYIAGKKQTVKGVLWHSTGANNPKLSRYIPDDGNLGPNRYNNHWDQPRPGKRQVCVHAFIGKDKNGEVQIYQTLPFDIEAWGAGKGTKGSANDGYIQFEICEDDLKDPAYFEAVYRAGVVLTAHLVKTYGLPINSTTITDHSGAYKLGLASNHSDIMHWFKIYGKTMESVRSDVRAILDPGTPAPAKPAPAPEKAPSVPILKYGSKGTAVRDLQADLIKIGFGPSDGLVDGSYGAKTREAVTKYQKAKRLQVDGIAGPETQASLAKDLAAFEAKAYLVRITAQALNVRSGPGAGHKVTTVIRAREVYTIIDEKDGWGKLKSGAGWINLDFTERL